MKEAYIQRSILDYLALRRHFHLRCNAGVYRAEHGSFIRYGTKGAPDIIVVANGKMIGIEVKTASGNLSEDREFRRSPQGPVESISSLARSMM